VLFLNVRLLSNITPKSVVEFNFRVPCSNAAKMRNPMKLAPKLANRSQPLVDWSSPYCGDLWRRYCISSEPRAPHFRPAF